MLIGAVTFALAVVALVIQSLLRLRFRRPDVRWVHGDTVPIVYWRLYQPVGAKLEDLGFAPCLWLRVESVLASRWGTVYRPVLRAADGVFALPEEHELLSPKRPINLVFGSLFDDDRWLLTHNHILHLTVALDPEGLDEDGYCATVEGHLAGHRRRVAELGAEGRSPWPEPSEEEGVRSLGAAMVRGVDAMASSGRAVPGPDGLQYTLVAAARKGWRALIGQARAPGPQSFLQLDPDGVPLELKLESWHRHEEKKERRSFRLTWLWVLAISAAATLASFAGWFDPWTGVVILVVLAIHEGGHFLAMLASGYRNVKVFFLPFLGAATIGKPIDRTLAKELFVLLAGPVPGALLGISLLLVPGASDNPWTSPLITFLIGLNLVNLLPFVPLDGGRVVHALVGDIHPWLSFGAKLLAGLAFALGWFLLDEPLLLLLTIVVALTFTLESRVAQIERDCRRNGVSEPKDVLARIVAIPGITAPKTISTMTAVMDRLSAAVPGSASRLVGGLVYGGLFGGLVSAPIVVMAAAGVWSGQHTEVSCEDPQLVVAPGGDAVHLRLEALFASPADAELTAAAIGVTEDDLCPHLPWSDEAPTEEQVHARRTISAVRNVEWDIAEDAKDPLAAQQRDAAAERVRHHGGEWVDEELLATYVKTGSVPADAESRFGMRRCEETAPRVYATAGGQTLTVDVLRPDADLAVEMVRYVCTRNPEWVAATTPGVH
ncbi:MAG: site-2 protease family protein [Sandaracinaceae bacterium]